MDQEELKSITWVSVHKADDRKYIPKKPLTFGEPEDLTPSYQGGAIFRWFDPNYGDQMKSIYDKEMCDKV